MRKGKIERQFKKVQNFYKDLYKKPLKRDWMARVVFPVQILLIFGGRFNRYFWYIRQKIYGLPNIDMLFQFLLAKFAESELFSF